MENKLAPFDFNSGTSDQCHTQVHPWRSLFKNAFIITHNSASTQRWIGVSRPVLGESLFSKSHMIGVILIYKSSIN